MSPFVRIKEVAAGDMLRPVAEDMHWMVADRNPAVEEVVVIVVETKRYRGNFRHREESTFAHKNLAESTFVPNVRAPHVDTKGVEVEAAVGLLLPDAAFGYQESTQKVRRKLLRCR
jgi:hypothetical protein